MVKMLLAETGLETDTTDYIVYINLTTKVARGASELWAFGLHQASVRMSYKENGTAI